MKYCFKVGEVSEFLFGSPEKSRLFFFVCMSVFVVFKYCTMLKYCAHDDTLNAIKYFSYLFSGANERSLLRQNIFIC